MDYDLENLISLIAEHTVLEPSYVTPEKTFAELGFDSLGHIQLITECEDIFKVEIPEESANAALTVAELHAAILAAAIQPCRYCHQQPNPKQSEEGHYLECSNLIDCPGWPYTEPHPTPALAIAAWNAITRAGSSSLKTGN
jgi:acyl carrier protein